MPRVRTRPLRPAGSEDAPALHVVTFGCQMNKYDSLLVEGRFRAEGYRLTDSLADADVVLFNTCSVRDHAEERVFSWLGELKEARRRRPELVLGVMGCMAQRLGEGIFARAPQVDLVCGTRRLQDLPRLVDELRAGRRAAGNPERGERVLAVEMDGDVRVDRRGETYAGGLCGFLTVMRGCDLNCTFCIVPTVRGRVRSRPIEELVREARWMVEGGARAITLLGQTVNAWGEDLPRPEPGEVRHRGRQGRPGLPDLLRALQEVEGLERIRLVTLHPSYVTRELALALRDCSKVDRFLPLPAQSGADACLRRMRRGYTTDLYRRRVDLLREAVPDLELGSDWIVGFPGETAQEFEATLRWVGEIEYAQGYVFQYDPRPGTRAWDLEDDVPRETKRERHQELLRTVERVALSRLERYVGQEAEVFVEEVGRAGLKGRERHHLPVLLQGPASWVGRTVRARVEAASPYGLTANVLAT